MVKCAHIASGKFSTAAPTASLAPSVKCVRIRVDVSWEIAPAMGSIIRDGLYFSANALLTVKVNFSQPGMPAWNTIHVLGRFPGIDRATVRAAFDAAIRQISPGSGSFQELMAPLSPFATNSRNDRVRQLFELAVR